MSIQLEDQSASLSLFHYNHADETSSEEVKQARGLIYDANKKLVCSSYAYTPEYTVTEQADVYKPLLEQFDKCTMFRSEEGTLLRLFFNDFRWTLSTHKRIDAFESKWSSQYSFGELFLQALEHWFTKGNGVGKLELEENIDLLDQFCNTLDRSYTYTFLLRTNKDTKIVCNTPEQPTILFSGYFQKDGLWCEGNPTLIPSPERLSFSSIEDMETYIQQVNPFEHQGVIIMLPDRKTTIKIVTPKTMKYKLIRGSEPDVNMAYFRVRSSKEDTELFVRMFPNVNVGRLEEELYNMTKYLHKMYVRRYIKKAFTVVHPVLFYVMKKCHEWHCSDRSKNIVTLEKMLDMIEQQPSSSIGKMHYEYIHSLE
jgi:hypothetical protein